MSKLRSQHTTTARPGGFTQTTGPAVNHEQADAFVKDAKSQLYTLMCTGFHGEDTFYEGAGERDKRLRALVAQCTVEDDHWTSGLIRWARGTANIRTGSLVAAVEFGRAAPSTVFGGRRAMIGQICQRADEPAEILAYWLGNYGRPIPAWLKRGLADAAVRLYTPRNAVKWDSSRSAWRMGDVVEMCHPRPKNLEQGILFERLIAARHGRERLAVVPEIAEYEHWIAMGAPLDQLPAVATWENVAGQRAMDAAAWEAIIPKMGYMALLRNIRNFEQAGVSRAALDTVASTLVHPDNVAKSRQLPYRFWSAWKHSGTMLFGPTLESALEFSTANIQPLGGRSLVMVDCSGSMTSPMSGKSKMTRAEAAGLFGAALYVKDAGVDLYLYDSQLYEVGLPRTSVLRVMNGLRFSGGATYTWTLTQEAWTRGFSKYRDVRGGLPYNRIIIITDEQAYGRADAWRWGGITGKQNDSSWVPANVPVYSWDLAGHKTTSFELGRGRYQFAGLNDASFGVIGLLESGQSGRWPWMLKIQAPPPGDFHQEYPTAAELVSHAPRDGDHEQDDEDQHE